MEKNENLNFLEKTENEFESQLGKKEYWDEFYKKEIIQHNNNSELIGDIWYGEHVQDKIVKYIIENFSDKKIKILDVGCGNAALLLKLYKKKYKNLYGMDYSENSIKLAYDILKNEIRNEEEFNSVITLYQQDINQETRKFINFDLIHDKGTLDAFLLNTENKIEFYIKFLTDIKKELGETIYIVSSCNYSSSEIKSFFIYEESRFVFKCEIPHKSFSFGGQAGQAATTLIFTIN